MKPDRKWVVVITACSALAGAFFAGRVWASGIPTPGTLTYTGSLANPDGTPVTAASKNIGITAYDAAIDGNMVPECTVQSTATNVAAGQFQIQLKDACTVKVQSTPNLWIEVLVDGASLGRTKLGAVPYAVEAGHALAADSATAATNAAHAAIADSATAATRAGGLNGPIEFLESVSNDVVTGALATDLIYTKVGLELTAGTWLIEAEASIRTTDVPDAVSIGLYDATHAVDIANSRSGIGQTGIGSNLSMCGLHTSRVLTLTSSATIQIKGYRNGGSTLAFGYTSSLAGGRNRITAMKLSDS